MENGTAPDYRFADAGGSQAEQFTTLIVDQTIELDDSGFEDVARFSYKICKEDERPQTAANQVSPGLIPQGTDRQELNRGDVLPVINEGYEEKLVFLKFNGEMKDKPSNSQRIQRLIDRGYNILPGVLERFDAYDETETAA
jgi:hypothetical protein